MYYDKYIKYKQKYLEAKIEQEGGVLPGKYIVFCSSSISSLNADIKKNYLTKNNFTYNETSIVEKDVNSDLPKWYSIAIELGPTSFFTKFEKNSKELKSMGSQVTGFIMKIFNKILLKLIKDPIKKQKLDKKLKLNTIKHTINKDVTDENNFQLILDFLNEKQSSNELTANDNLLDTVLVIQVNLLKKNKLIKKVIFQELKPTRKLTVNTSSEIEKLVSETTPTDIPEQEGGKGIFSSFNSSYYGSYLRAQIIGDLIVLISTAIISEF